MADIKLGASALDGFYIGSTAVDKVYLGDVELFSAAPPFDSGILQNGTFNDSTGVSIPSGGYTVSGGLLNYTGGGAKKVRLNLSTDMVVGNTYDITFTISNAGTARMAWYAGNQNETIQGNTNYGNGTHTISGYVHSVADRGEISIVSQSSGGGTTYSIDNIAVTKDVSLELFRDNAAADTHGEVNATTGFSTLGNTSMAVNSTDQHTGTYCIELENGAAGGGFDRVEYDITVENGAQYNVSLWARELVGSDGRIQLWSGVTGWSTVVLTNTWTEYTATVTATSTTMKMRFYPNNGSGAAGDKILLDNISVTKVPVVNLYNFVNAVSDDDIDSNTGWSATSTFFANSITSTDSGENFSIGIITRSTSTSSTSSLSHTLPTLTISQAYKMTIRYKMDYDVATAPVQNPFFNWSGVSNTTYPSVYSDAGQFVEVEVLFTATSATPSMKIYPHYNNGTGRTLNDTLEISSIIIEEV